MTASRLPWLRPATGWPSRRAVLVRLDDRKAHTLEVGAGYSTTQGSGIDGRYVLYNRLGRADSLIFTGRLYEHSAKARPRNWICRTSCARTKY